MFAPQPTPSFQEPAHSLSREAGRQKSGKLWSNLAEICALLRIPAPAGTPSAGEDVLFQHIQFKTGQRIHTIGQPFEMLYIVNSGFLKTVMIDELGNEQVLSFPMKSDLLGVDGIHSRFHTSEAVALSDCDLILVPFKKLTSLGKTYPELEHAMYGVMSRELIREQAMICMLGTLGGRSCRTLSGLPLGPFRANGIFAPHLQPAHDTTRNWKLYRSDTGNRQPDTLGTP